jgi:hypothetical protein
MRSPELVGNELGELPWLRRRRRRPVVDVTKLFHPSS